MCTKINCFAVSGARDFFPIDILQKNWLLDKWRTISLTHNFKEYDSSIVEHANVWTKSDGDNTNNDDILQEMFTVSDGNKNVQLVLRPEMTRTVCRMVLYHIKNNVMPFKWFSVSQCWRNESTTLGRGREFYQWNNDIFGADNVQYEAEIFSVTVSFLKSVGLTSNDVVIKVSDKKFVEFFLMGKYNGYYNEVFSIIDKMGKKNLVELEQMLVNVGMDRPLISELFDFISIKTIPELKSVLGSSVIVEMEELFSLLEVYGILDWVELDLSIARGLSYYTGIVFEGIFKHTKMKRSICGGGRYDNLLTSYGYPEKVPCVGFGMGDMPIVEGLIELGKLPKFKLTTEYCIIAFPELYTEAIKIANTLRSKGHTVDLYMDKGNKFKLKKAFSYADKIGANKVLLVAPDEFARNTVKIKHLRNKNDEDISIGTEILLSDL